MRKVMPTSFNRFCAMKNRLINLTMGAVILFGCQAKVHGNQSDSAFGVLQILDRRSALGAPVISNEVKAGTWNDLK
jgi:hypothetical protein